MTTERICKCCGKTIEGVPRFEMCMSCYRKDYYRKNPAYREKAIASALKRYHERKAK